MKLPMLSRFGFTLAETLATVAVCAIVAASIMMLLGTVARGVRTGEAYSEARQRSEIAAERVSALVRSAVMVLDCSDDSITVWTGDVDGSGGIGPHELRRIAWDTNAKSIMIHEDSGVTSGAIDDYSRSDAIAAAGLFSSKVIANDIVACEFSMNDLGRAAQIRFTMDRGDVQEVKSVFVRLRCSGDDL